MRVVVYKSLYLVIIAAGLLLAACGGTTPTPGSGDATVSSVEITGVPSPAQVQVGSTVALSATVTGSSGVSQEVTWSSSNTSLATVSADGVVTGVSVGSVDITATSTVDTTKSDMETLSVTAVATDCSSPEELPSVLNNDTTFVAGNCYRVVTGQFDVRAELTIQPGVTILADADTRIDIESDGVIKAVGTAAQPITIRGSTANKGFWNGVRVVSGDANNVLEYVNISDAGGSSTYPSNLWLASSGKLALTNSTLSNSATNGIYITSGGQFEAFSANTFSANAVVMNIVPDNMSQLDNASTYADGNTENYIDVRGGSTIANGTWPKTDAPFRVLASSQLDVRSDIKVEAGARLEFEGSSRLDVESDGSLNASDPGSAEPITFKGTTATAGSWDGIRINSDSISNVFDNVVISDAGGSSTYPSNLWLASSGKLALTNSTLSNSATNGIYITSGGQFEAFSANTFSANAVVMNIVPDNMSQLDNASTYADGNTENYIDVRGGSTIANGTWPKTDAPFRVLASSQLDVRSDIKVEAGARLEFEGSSRLDVESDGSLNAVGDASNIIVFTGTSAVKGAWDAIRVNSDSTSNVLSFVEVSFGGDNTTYPANIWLASSGKLNLNNSKISDSDSFGVYVTTGGQLNASGNVYSNNTSGDIGP